MLHIIIKIYRLHKLIRKRDLFILILPHGWNDVVHDKKAIKGEENKQQYSYTAKQEY